MERNVSLLLRLEDLVVPSPSVLLKSGVGVTVIPTPYDDWAAYRVAWLDKAPRSRKGNYLLSLSALALLGFTHGSW